MKKYIKYDVCIESVLQVRIFIIQFWKTFEVLLVYHSKNLEISYQKIVKKLIKCFQGLTPIS